MASPEKDIRQRSQSFGKAPEVLPEPEAVRRELAEIARDYCADKTLDALCLFIQVHRCVFERIASSKFPQMVALNPLFARRFATVCKAFLAFDEFNDGPRIWRRALGFYMDHPTQVVRALVMMAEAHIVEDLSEALYDLESETGTPIDQAQFEGVLDDIIACLKELNSSVEGAEGIVDFLYFNIGRHFGVIRGFQNIAVAQLRHAAWDEYQLHKRFALNQRMRKK